MIEFSSKYLSFKDTLNCGQVFRFREHEKGYLVFSGDRCAYCYEEGGAAYIDGDDYFFDYFDLSRDYSKIVEAARSYGIEKLTRSATLHSGLRILKQDGYEALISFIISQNNNIPRIKGIIERLCAALGEKKNFKGIDYYAFPKPHSLAEAPLPLLKEIGLGYRVEYVKRAAEMILSGEINLEELAKKDTLSLRRSLIAIKGVGEKVADCTLLFGFNHTDSFPVDTWIEKLYHEDFNGKLTDRKKITDFFVDLFKENSGYVQQYLFYAKREGEL